MERDREPGDPRGATFLGNKFCGWSNASLASMSLLFVEITRSGLLWEGRTDEL